MGEFCNSLAVCSVKWDKVFKSGLSKFCGRQPLNTCFRIRSFITVWKSEKQTRKINFEKHDEGLQYFQICYWISDKVVFIS